MEVADIGGNCVRFAAIRFNGALNFFQFHAASAHQHQFGARCRVGFGDGAPDAFARSGDDCEPSVQTE